MFTRLLGRRFFPPWARNHDEGVRLRFALGVYSAQTAHRSKRTLLAASCQAGGRLSHAHRTAAVLRGILSIRTPIACGATECKFDLIESRTRKI